MEKKLAEEKPIEEVSNLSMEERVARLEGALGWRNISLILSKKHIQITICFLILAIISSCIGLGLPNHEYQIVLGALTVCLLYHKEVFSKAEGQLYYLLFILNSYLVSVIYKLLIGSGVKKPFFFIRYPDIMLGSSNGKDQGLFDVIPQFGLSWHDSPLAKWSIDITIIQTFLLIITMLGAAVDFQPFASLTAVILILVSIPALVDFNWDWVFPTLILSSIAFYFQLSTNTEE